MFAEMGQAYFLNPEPITMHDRVGADKHAALLIAGGGMFSLKGPVGVGMAGAR